MAGACLFAVWSSQRFSAHEAAWQFSVLGLAALYLIGVIGWLARRPWAPWYSLGVGALGTIGLIDVFLAHGLTGVVTFGFPLHVCMLVAGLVEGWLQRPRLNLREILSTSLATAALPGALIFGLAPYESSATAVKVLVCSLSLLGSVIGLCRGRAWALLLLPAAAVGLVASVFTSPASVAMEVAHPMFPVNATVNVFGLGLASASLGVAALLPWVPALVRFFKSPH